MADVGRALAAFFFILVPFVRENFVLIALAILGTNLGMALFRFSTVAYLGDLFKPGERSKANGVINLMSGASAPTPACTTSHRHWPRSPAPSWSAG